MKDILNSIKYGLHGSASGGKGNNYLTLKLLINKLGNNNLKKSFCIYEIPFLIAISELIFKN